MLYFSYGSNMSIRRLKVRTPSAEFASVARLTQHVMRFHKAGRDGSAKCDALFTGDNADSVIGVVFRIARKQQSALDFAEGLGNGYERKEVQLLSSTKLRLQAFTYYATLIDASMKPYHWYKHHVLVGCHEHKLPTAYIKQIAEIDSVADPDKKRAAREAALYST